MTSPAGGAGGVGRPVDGVELHTRDRPQSLSSAPEEGPSEEKAPLESEKCHHPGQPWLVGQCQILSATSQRSDAQEDEKEQEQEEGWG